MQRRGDLARRSGIALAVGFPLAITATFLASLVFRATGLTPEEFDAAEHAVANLISSPDAFTVIVALCAGAADMVSLSTVKSGLADPARDQPGGDPDRRGTRAERAAMALPPPPPGAHPHRARARRLTLQSVETASSPA